MNLTRRRFLSWLPAPIIVSAASIMPIKPLEPTISFDGTTDFLLSEGNIASGTFHVTGTTILTPRIIAGEALKILERELRFVPALPLRVGDTVRFG